MSKQTNCGCYAKISEKDPRAKLWKKIFGDLKFPLKHPLINSRHTDSDMKMYDGDANALSSEQRELLISEMATKFNVEPSVIENELDRDGVVPIGIDNVSVSWCEKHSRMLVL